MRNKKISNNEPVYLIKVFANRKMIDRCRTYSKRRILNFVRTIKWQIDGLKVYLRVSYGKQLNNYGKMESFWNDGYYKNKEDFNLALEAFTED